MKARIPRRTTASSFSRIASAAIPLLLAAVLLLSGPELRGEARWWNSAWKYRRKVVLNRLAQRWPDAPAAWVKFLCAGAMKKDGSDLRVTTSRGRPVKCALKGIGPGDEALVVFEVDKAEDEYYVYYGNPSAKALPPWDPKRGLLLETRKRGPGNPVSWAAMQRILQKSTYVYGRGYRPKIFDGYNPFGPNEDYVSIYRGWLLAPVSGRYTFCTASDDASFMFIDGKLVCQWPGYHGAGAGLWGRFSGTIVLDKGMHRIEYYHLQAKDASACVAGWKQPGQEKKDVSLIPDWAFPGLIEAKAHGQEERSAPLSADFTCTVRADLQLDDFSYQMAAFTPVVHAWSSVKSWRWDFGDGGVSREEKPVHVFLSPGVFPVTLEVTDAKGRKASVTHRVQVIYVVKPNERSYLVERRLKQFEPFVKGYEVDRLDAVSVAALWTFYDRAGKAAELKKLALAALRLLPRLPASQVEKLAVKLGDFLDADLDMPKKALEAYEVMLKLPSKAGRAKGYIKMGDVWLFRLEDTSKAEDYYRKALELVKGTRAPEERFSLVRLGDCARFRGEYDPAMEWYSKAEAILLSGRTPRQTLTLRGAYAQSVESWLRRKDYDAAAKELDMWEWEFPTERLEGYSTFLRVKLLMARGELDDAVKEAEILCKVNPRSNYADRLLMKVYECWMKKGDKMRAAAALRRIIKDYPASPLVPEAKSKLAALR